MTHFKAMPKKSDVVEVGDTIECDSCQGRGWYSMAPATDNQNYNDHYQTDHPCERCDKFGYLIVDAINNAGKLFLAKDYDEGWYEEEYY